MKINPKYVGEFHQLEAYGFVKDKEHPAWVKIVLSAKGKAYAVCIAEATREFGVMCKEHADETIYNWMIKDLIAANLVELL